MAPSLRPLPLLGGQRTPSIYSNFVVLDLNNFKLGGGPAGLGTTAIGVHATAFALLVGFRPENPSADGTTVTVDWDAQTVTVIP